MLLCLWNTKLFAINTSFDVRLVITVESWYHIMQLHIQTTQNTEMMMMRAGSGERGAGSGVLILSSSMLYVWYLLDMYHTILSYLISCKYE